MSDTKYTFKDFKSDSEVRWCPGCGDYGILTAVQRAMAELEDVEHEDHAVISGIGCSSRFPYYMNTFGFHTIHGRAAAIATGVKCANPKLMVWQISGDGDAMAIGGNHFIHAIRRNVDLNMIVFNNKIYGLTKGQYSPTSDRGCVTKTSPFGTIENSFNVGQLVLGAGGTFFARTLDVNMKHNQQMCLEAAGFKGSAVIEVLQNCVIFNDGIHFEITKAEDKKNKQLFLEHGKPMIYGENDNLGLMLDKKGKLISVEIGKNGISEADILVHDAHCEDAFIHNHLIGMSLPDLPVAFGVIRAVKSPPYNECLEEQLEDVGNKSKIHNMDELMNAGDTWTVN
ncbi:MAG: 2-oxoacid:ferredoxin oxidoreductase subunit beta [Bacteroidales bacterium]